MLAPILLALSLLVWWQLGWPIFFKQQRPGKDGAIFTLIKFRTLTDARDARGQLLQDEQRLHPFGQWLRRLSLDELPELIHVVRGEMSLVGPRPLRVEYLERYTPEQACRHAVRPGITGWAQVNGRNTLSWEEKFSLDLWYVDHQSFGLDIKILLMTAWQWFQYTGINEPGQATASPFAGNQLQGLHQCARDREPDRHHQEKKDDNGKTAASCSITLGQKHDGESNLRRSVNRLE